VLCERAGAAQPDGAADAAAVALAGALARLTLAGVPPDSLRALAAALRRTPGGCPRLALAAARLVRCASAGGAWDSARSRDASAAVLNTGVLGGLIDAMAAAPRDAELQREGSLAVGAWALAAVSGRQPGGEQRRDEPLALFAAAALARLGAVDGGDEEGFDALQMHAQARREAAEELMCGVDHSTARVCCPGGRSSDARDTRSSSPPSC
jgi:hypothetical protein